MEDHGALLAPQLLQLLTALGFARGEEALEGKAARRQTRHRQGVHRRAAAGDGDDGHALLGAELHQILAGVGDGRRARIGDEGAALAAQQALDDLLTCAGTVMLMIAHHGLFDLEVVQQLQRHPLILCGDEIHRGESFNGAGREIA